MGSTAGHKSTCADNYILGCTSYSTMMLKPMNILLADDNGANRLIARTILERAGHTVTTAKNGAGAVSAVKLQIFNLIILDIMMPVMDGMRALRKIRRENAGAAHIPIIALTSYHSTADRQRYLMAGFDAVLSKPLHPGDTEKALNPNATAMPRHVETRPPLATELLNITIIEQLSGAGSPATLRRIQDRFWDSVSDQSEIMKRALPDAQRGDGAFLSQFRRAVHGMKGACASMGLSRASDVARRLQNAPPEAITELLRELVEALQESREPLRDALNPAAGQLDRSVQMR